jgi:hypothetical protein
MVMRLRPNFFGPVLLAAIACVTVSNAVAQSSDQNLPTPVLANEINGTITALDLGDSRLTRHFYAFNASPGDLIITMDSKNLNGDIDVFTAITFRPLMKTSMYANTQMPEVTKSIYLRAHQILILRVEARTPNDDPGSYQIRFRGSFEPFAGGIPVAEAGESTSETTRSARGTKKVSSVGATILEPPVESAAKSEPTPASVSEKEASSEKSTAPVGAASSNETPKRIEASKSASARTPARSTSRNSRRRAPSRSKPPTTTKETAKTTPANNESKPAESEAVKKPTASDEEGKSKATPSANTEKPSQDVNPPVGARLIIEEKDGTKIDRPMATVRRVVVEGNTIVIVMKTGRIERVPMSLVIRMAIEP